VRQALFFIVYLYILLFSGIRIAPGNPADGMLKFARGEIPLMPWMRNVHYPVRWMTGFLLVVLTAVSCAPEPAAQPTAVVQISTVIQLATVVHTVEVTRIVEVPVAVTYTPTPMYSPTFTETPTITPTFTWSPTTTLTPTFTKSPTYSPPRIRIDVHAQCKFGPGAAYLFKYDIPEGVTMEVLGWMEILSHKTSGAWEPTMWAYVKALGGTNPCWVNATLGTVTRGALTDAPMYTARLPYSQLYQPPKSVSARRDGNIVTVIWSSVWMTEDDYRGYLVEAWVCHNGQLYFTPVGYQDVNAASPAVAIPDEPGCSEPSSGRLYTVEKHGYTQWVHIPWPPAE
jgi:hypothetical protein